MSSKNIHVSNKLLGAIINGKNSHANVAGNVPLVGKQLVSYKTIKKNRKLTEWGLVVPQSKK